jgi:CBS domain-containing protein
MQTDEFTNRYGETTDLTQVNVRQRQACFLALDASTAANSCRESSITSEVPMRVKDVVTKKAISVSPQATVAEALDTMMRSRVSGLPVIDETGSLVGIISEADFLRRSELGTGQPPAHWLASIFLPGRAAEIYARAHARRVNEAMSTPVVTIDQDASLDDALALMENRRVKRLPVVSEGKVVGMIARADFVHALALFVREPYDVALVSDAQIKRRIETEMQAQLWAPVASVDVAVKDGVVSLQGTLSDERERNAVHALIENVEGVRMIHDHILWAEPYSGMVAPSPEDAAKRNVA